MGKAGETLNILVPMAVSFMDFSIRYGHQSGLGWSMRVGGSGMSWKVEIEDTQDDIMTGCHLMGSSPMSAIGPFVECKALSRGSSSMKCDKAYTFSTFPFITPELTQ